MTHLALLLNADLDVAVSFDPTRITGEARVHHEETIPKDVPARGFDPPNLTPPGVVCTNYTISDELNKE